MVNAIKKFSVAAALYLISLAVSVTSDPIGRIMYTVAVTCALIAIISIMIDRWPRLIPWLPIPNSWKWDRLAIPSELTKSFIQGQHFKIALLAEDNCIRDRTFEDCHIYGPAVLVGTGVGAIVGCSFDGELDEVFLVLAESQKVVIGPINLQNCFFKRCHFHSVGFLGPKEVLDKFRSSSVTGEQFG